MNSILLLGAYSDMGQSIARKYAEAGYEIWLAGRKREKLDALRSDLEIRWKVKALCFEFDARDFESHGAFVNQLPGLPTVTVVIFGYLGDQAQAVNSWDESRSIIESNYTGAVSVLNHLKGKYETKGEGTIVGISSVAGDRGRMSNFIYGSAKAGFTAYLSGLRNDLYAKGVHVVTVKPGFVATRMTEDLDLPKMLTSSADHVADRIFSAVKKKKNTIYISWKWRWIMLIIKNIPEFVFKKLKL